MGHDVFISHSSKDKTTADAVCAVLESHGIRCWVAPRDIIPGRNWGAAIVEAIKGARVMVLIFSSHANNSQQINREVERAVNRGIPVIPLRIEDVVPTDALEYFLSSPHWLDAFSPPLEKHLQYLAKIIRQILETEKPPQSVIPGQISEKQTPIPTTPATVRGSLSNDSRSRFFKFGRREKLLLVSAGVAAVIIVVASLVKHQPLPPPDVSHTQESPRPSGVISTKQEEISPKPEPDLAPLRIQRINDMKQILLAAHLYADDFEDCWPDSLLNTNFNNYFNKSDLIKRFASFSYDKPASNEVREAASTLAVLFEKTPVAPPGELVGFADGHVETVTDSSQLRRPQPEQPKGPSYEDYMSSATAKKGNHDIAGALADYDKAIQINPGWPAAYISRCQLRHQNNDIDGAIDDLNHAIKILPNSAPLYTSRGGLKKEKNDIDGAMADFNQAIKLKPGAAENYAWRGLCKLEKKDPEGAIEDYNMAIGLKPDFEDAYYYRAYAREQIHDTSGAIEDYKAVLRINPNATDAQTALRKLTD